MLFVNREILSVVILYVSINAFSISAANVTFSIFSKDKREINLLKSYAAQFQYGLFCLIFEITLVQ